MFHHILYFFSTVLINVMTMNGYLSFSVHTVVINLYWSEDNLQSITRYF